MYGERRRREGGEQERGLFHDRKELVFTHLSDATISAALIWTICDFHGSIHKSGFSYKNSR